MYLSLQYAMSKLLNPGRGDFLSMGMGIEARAERCAGFWQPHLECTKEFQRRQVEALAGAGSVSVLGAGSLLDIETDLLKEKFSKISFFDANPLAKRAWRKFARTLRGHHELDCSYDDITATLDYWTESLKEFLRDSRKADEGKLGNFLAALQCCNEPARWMDSDVVFSINLLSQIPIYWRDRVYGLLSRYWGVDSDADGKLPEPVQSALDYTMSELQRHHLQRLSASRAELVVIISDTRFMYYVKESAPWRVLPALYLPGELKLDGFRLSDRSQWFWHIAPQDVEQPEHGVIHDVGAWSFTRWKPVYQV